MKYLDTFHRAEPQEPTLAPDFVAKVLHLDRKKVCVEVNRIAAEKLVFECSDEDLAALCRDLGETVARKREEYYTALEAQAKALSERSRRAGR
jgi:hypothetical protein